MYIARWPGKVNREFALESDWGHESGYTEEVKFESGKKRIHLKNSYVPLVYPLSLDLDGEMPAEGTDTEFDIFMKWYETDLRYGVLPFSMPRIRYKKPAHIHIQTGETGVYRFAPGSLKPGETDGLIPVTFELEELSYTKEVPVKLIAIDGKILLLPGRKAIVAKGV